MELAGLTVGVAGLVGIFSACLDVIERVDAYKEFGSESRNIIARFEGDKLRLRRWARAVGISDTNEKSSVNYRLYDQEMESVVKAILNSAYEIFDAAELTRSKLRIKLEENGIFSSIPDVSSDMIKVKLARMPSASVRGGIGWALNRKGRFTNQVESFSKLIDVLYDLVPPKDPGYEGHIHDGQLQKDSLGVEKEITIILDDMRRRARIQSLNAVKEWLVITHFEEDNNIVQFFDKQVSSRLEGTCQWIFSNPAYCACILGDDLESRAKILWICASAGSGKTILCASLVEHLISLKSLTVAYFFASPHAQSGGEPSFIIRSWIAQLASLDPDVQEYLGGCAETGQRATDSTVWSTFGSILSINRDYVFILDGFDEYHRLDDARAEFLQNLKARISGTSAKVLIFSRDETDIRAELTPPLVHNAGYSLLECKIRKEHVQHDISRFSKSVVDKKLPKKGDDLRTELAEQLADKCDGMFLWIKLQQDQIRSGKTAKQLQNIVKNMPTGLTKTYERNWRYIQSRLPEDQERALAILRWVTFAFRPLTVAEITEALCFELGDDENGVDLEDLEDTIGNVDEDYINTEIIDLCAALVEVRAEKPEDGPGSRTVHLIHTSVREFLVTTLPLNRLLGLDQSPTTEQHHSLIASRCLRYMISDDVWVTEGNNHKYAFLHYAARYWNNHVDMAKSDTKLSSLVSNFLSLENTNFLKWAKYFELSTIEIADGSQNFESAAEPGPPLYYAALFDLDPTMETIWANDRTQLNRSGGEFGSALQAVCATNLESAFNKLIAWGAAPDTKGGRFGAPINAAVASRLIGMTRTLVGRGVSLEERDNFQRTPLCIAALNGDIEIVRLLIGAGAKVDGWETRAPLFIAAWCGHFEVVRLLLDMDANKEVIDTTGFTPRTPLTISLWSDHTDVANLLIERGADIKFVNSHGWTPLHVASERGNLGMCKLLLEKGALPSVVNKFGWTPLWLASTNGHLEVVKLLIEKEADTTVKNCHELIPSHNASQSADSETTEDPTQKKAYIDVANEIGNTALDTAIRNGWVEIARFLIERNADVIHQSPLMGNPINSLAFEGNTDLLRLVYEKHPLIGQPRDADGRTALHLSVRGGHVDTFEYLVGIGYGAELNDAAGKGVLSYASSSGSSQMVRAVLDKGFVGAQLDGHWSPLHWACRAGSPEVIEELVKQGVRGERVKVFHPEGEWTPASIAIFHEHGKVLEGLSTIAKSHIGFEGNGDPAQIPQWTRKKKGGLYCNSCDHEIQGPYWHCESCDDWDYCFMCQPFYGHLHEGHEYGWFDDE